MLFYLSLYYNRTFPVHYQQYFLSVLSIFFSSYRKNPTLFRHKLPLSCLSFIFIFFWLSLLDHYYKFHLTRLIHPMSVFQNIGHLGMASAAKFFFNYITYNIRFSYFFRLNSNHVSSPLLKCKPSSISLSVQCRPTVCCSGKLPHLALRDLPFCTGRWLQPASIFTSYSLE